VVKIKCRELAKKVYASEEGKKVLELHEADICVYVMNTFGLRMNLHQAARLRKFAEAIEDREQATN
jgi:hypothetical protein